MSATFVLLRARQDISFLDDVKVSWRVGPDYDEGFFGHKPIELRVVEVAA